MNARYDLSKLPPFTLLDEPQLSFDTNDSQLDTNPLRGLDHHGPYSLSVFRTFTPALRLATVAPASGWDGLKNLVATLRSQQQPGDRREYVPAYRGFEGVFGIPLEAAQDRNAHIKLESSLDALGQGGSPQERLMQALRSSLDRLQLVRDTFDVALVHLPDAWASAFRADGFDAHDALKALGAMYAIPTQVVNDRAFTFRYKASLAWRLGIALYVKAGGVPWKLAPIEQVPEGTAYIGLAYALRGDPRNAHFVTCCSQVFDADGGGMEFVAFEARDPVADVNEARRNPFLSQNDMRAVLARSLSIYQLRNGGQLPRRLVVHKRSAFKQEEIEGALDALVAVKEVEFIEVASSPGWRGVWLKQGRNQRTPSEPDGFPVPRGTVLQRTGNSALVWVAGNAPRASLSGDYYQGKKSIPRPINLIRHAGSGPLTLVGLEALALTKMDWNNDALYAPVPVTIRYSQRLAKTIANVPDLPGKTYAYRLFM